MVHAAANPKIAGNRTIAIHHAAQSLSSERIRNRSQTAKPIAVAGTRTRSDRHGRVLAGVTVSKAIPGNVPMTTAHNGI
jgi:hypothetical protein